MKLLLVLLVLSRAGVPACAAELPAVPHVIVIGVDGLSIDGIARGDVPNLRRLIARSAWTLEARGVLPTLSSPNWESMITGAGPEQHGITSNGWFRKMVEIKPVCHGPDGKFPTIFQTLRTQRPQSVIAIFHDWGGFADLVERHAPSVMEHTSGPAKTMAAAVAYWRELRPDLMFVHLDNVDHAGHSYGWSTPEYFRAVAEADHQVGVMLDMLDRLAAWDSTYVLVTSDHGGDPNGGHGITRGHGKNSLAEIQIPWILAGPDVEAGRITTPVSTLDTALTLAWILGLDTPDCWVGRSVLTAFRNEAVLTRVASRAEERRGRTPEAPVISGGHAGEPTTAALR